MARHSNANITGLLIVTITYFAHVLEGPEDAVNNALADILTDSRHHEIVMIQRLENQRRRFPHWRMTRFDQENFATVSLTPLFAELHASPSSDALVRFKLLTDAMARSGHTNAA